MYKRNLLCLVSGLQVYYNVNGFIYEHWSWHDFHELID